jgi:hypothetical protein
MALDLNGALYEAQIAASGTTRTTNSTFQLDLQAGGNPFPAVTAIALRTNSGLAANLDPNNSTFGFYIGNADGTNIKSLNASLKTLSVTAATVPSTALMLAASAALLALRGVRKTRA